MRLLTLTCIPLRVYALAALGLVADGLYTCPSAINPVPSAFLGAATGHATTLITTPDSLFLFPTPDTTGAQFCVLNVLVNPNAPRQLFITLGSTSNTPADQDVTCAFLDLTHAPHAIFNVSDPSGASCPIATGEPFSGWRPAQSAPLPACPPSSAPLPAALQGQGRLSDAQASGNSHLLLHGTAWVTVLQGALVTTQCIAAVAPIAQGVTQLLLSNAEKEGAPAQACVWVAPSPPSHLQYKFGPASGGCPADFSHPATIPFNFSGPAAADPAAASAAPAFSQTDFVVSFWVDPIVPPAQFPLEYARIARANFSAVMGGFGALEPVGVAAQVAACAAAGLLCIPSSCETAAAPGGAGSCIGLGLNSSALLGYQLWDEPAEKDFASVAAWMASVAARTAPHAPLRFVNLLPNYADFPASYEEYLDSFVRTVHPDILSFDHYPLFYPGSDRDTITNVSQAGYICNLESVRAAALAAGVGFWNFMNVRFASRIGY